MTKIKAVCFDFDGTLVNTFEHIVQAFEKVLIENNLEPDREVIRALVGKTLEECYKILLPDVEASVPMARHHELQQTSEMYELIVLYDGIMDTLDALHAQDIKCAVVTNRTQPSLGLILDHTGLAEKFDLFVGPEHVSHNKPHPEPLEFAAKKLGVSAHEIIMVGDTHIDVAASKAAGATCVGLTHGFGTRAELEEAGADYVIDNVEELIPIVIK